MGCTERTCGKKKGGRASDPRMAATDGTDDMLPDWEYQHLLAGASFLKQVIRAEQSALEKLRCSCVRTHLLATAPMCQTTSLDKAVIARQHAPRLAYAFDLIVSD